MSTVPELYMREAMGVVSSNRNSVFSSTQIATLRKCLLDSKTRRMWNNSHYNESTQVFVIIDPTGGGTSCLALLSMVYIGPEFLIVSAR